MVAAAGAVAPDVAAVAVAEAPDVATVAEEEARDAEEAVVPAVPREQ